MSSKTILVHLGFMYFVAFCISVLQCAEIWCVAAYCRLASSLACSVAHRSASFGLQRCRPPHQTYINSDTPLEVHVICCQYIPLTFSTCKHNQYRHQSCSMHYALIQNISYCNWKTMTHWSTTLFIFILCFYYICTLYICTAQCTSFARLDA